MNLPEAMRGKWATGLSIARRGSGTGRLQRRPRHLQVPPSLLARAAEVIE